MKRKAVCSITHLILHYESVMGQNFYYVTYNVPGRLVSFSNVLSLIGLVNHNFMKSSQRCFTKLFFYINVSISNKTDV